MHKINDDLPHISVRERNGVLSDALLLTKAAELAQELGIRLSTSSNPNCSHHQSVPVSSTASSSQPVAAPPTVNHQLVTATPPVNHQPVTATPQVSHQPVTATPTISSQPVAATITVSSRQLSPTASSNDDLTVDGQLILSNGWLSRWKGRHGIFGVRLHGEAGDADQQGVARAQRELPGIIEKYQPEDVFNIDETGLFYRHAVSDLIKAHAHT